MVCILKKSREGRPTSFTSGSLLHWFSLLQGRRLSLALRADALAAKALQPITGSPLSESTGEALPEGQSLSSDNQPAADEQNSADTPGLLDQPPLEWFGKIMEKILADGGQPPKLGKVPRLTLPTLAFLLISAHPKLLNMIHRMAVPAPVMWCVQLMEGLGGCRGMHLGG